MTVAENSAICRGSCKGHFIRHSGEGRNPELLENPGFRVAPGFRRGCPKWRFLLDL